jgi:hypothetical protein
LLHFLQKKKSLLLFVRGGFMRVQASLFLSVPSRLAALRRRLDPRMAQCIAPHVTMIYDDEAPDAGLLLERLRVACADLAPIALWLGCVEMFAAPAAGLYVATRASTAFEMLRSRVLRPPFAPRGKMVRPHVTLLHPRSVGAAPADWRACAGLSIDWASTVNEVTVIQSDGGAWTVVARFPLGGA